MDWFWLLVPVVIFGLLWFIMHLSKSTPTLDDSMAVPRHVPTYKGIADDMRRQVNVRNKDGRVP
jgi:hypothetical protein